MQELKDAIRDVPDFPKQGIVFKDITTLLKQADLFKKAINVFVEKYKEKDIKYVVGIESRGFILGSILAYLLNAGFVPVRKKGKLPSETINEEYELEYGTDILEIHKDSIPKGANTLIVDDLLATGGTFAAVVSLINKLEGNVAGVACLIELTFLKGRDKLENVEDIFSLIKY